MAKRKPLREPVNAAILVHMTRSECERINAAAPEGMSASKWCRLALLEKVDEHEAQEQLATVDANKNKAKPCQKETTRK